ncbi:MAG: hypothetical protein AAGH79_10485 [Bacteroidota bacterium]
MESNTPKRLPLFQWLLQRVYFPFVNLILYGNFWIALAALCLTWQTEFLLLGSLDIDRPVAWFNFGGTLFLYALHRLVGMEKVKAFADRGRYYIIARYANHIKVYSVLGALMAAWFFWQVQATTRWIMILPGILSLGYVLPILAGGKRLRDLHYLKIFLVAGIWSWLTVVVPAWELGLGANIPVWVLFVERSLFVFAITIPFDIRDLQVDQHTQVQTIPARIGVESAKRLSFLLLGASLLLAGLNGYLQLYSWPLAIGVLAYTIITFGLVRNAYPTRSDYYYTGWLDGTMILQGLLLGLCFWLLS